MRLRLLLLRISIHAPARGATKLTYCKTNILRISIHAPARGATVFPTSLVISILFQSTPPRGERQSVTGIPLYLSNFNPRPREGSDLIRFANAICFSISIHAPARGATGLHDKLKPVTLLFQSTPPRGERHC